MLEEDNLCLQTLHIRKVVFTHIDYKILLLNSLVLLILQLLGILIHQE